MRRIDKYRQEDGVGTALTHGVNQPIGGKELQTQMARLEGRSTKARILTSNVTMRAQHSGGETVTSTLCFTHCREVFSVCKLKGFRLTNPEYEPTARIHHTGGIPQRFSDALHTRCAGRCGWVGHLHGREGREESSPTAGREEVPETHTYGYQYGHGACRSPDSARLENHFRQTV